MERKIMIGSLAVAAGAVGLRPTASESAEAKPQEMSEQDVKRLDRAAAKRERKNAKRLRDWTGVK